MGYLKESGQLTPEVRMKLEHAINLGYQRVLTFETRQSGGGFDWHGCPPAKTILTAYGILMLHDMNKVYPIDTAVVDRAVDVLNRRQKGDGSFEVDLPMHTWHQLGQGANLPITAYVAWSLSEAARPNLRATQYVESRWRSTKDPYVLALCVNALRAADSPEYADAAKALESTATVEDDQAYWESASQGLCYATGKLAHVEATAMAMMALPRSALLRKAQAYLIRSRDPRGGWSSTQSTILAIKALLGAGKRSAGAGLVRVSVDGREVAAFERITESNADVVQQVNITKHLPAGSSRVELTVEGDVEPTYQIVTRYYRPWSSVVEPEKESPIEITSTYDRTTLTRQETLRGDVEIRYRGTSTFMAIVDLGIPPGFVPEPEPLEALVREKVIDKFSLTGRQITLYFGALKAGDAIRFSYTLRPRFPVKVQAPATQAYEYYTPENRARGARATITVTE